VLSEKDGLSEACRANFDNPPTMPKRNIERANSCADTARALTRHGNAGAEGSLGHPTLLILRAARCKRVEPPVEKVGGQRCR